ncbi:hypothetical protein [Acinetobacter indicus]|uniref:hypothetical protein n=1 Tax=Acinetobacter indicus TaxID=756892 RepID=UPI000CEC8BBD|nr:hypothetical protein [Acinetobacter indicus]
MTYFINLKKLGVKSTVLASSIVLVACGGGGSDGYYNTDNSNTTNPPNSGGDNTSTTDTSQVATHLTRALQNASGQEIQLAPDNSKVYLAVKALNEDNGGIANKNIRLSIATNEFGVSSTNSVVATDENGVAKFEINVPALAQAEGSVQLTATVDGTSVSIPYTLNIKKSSTIVSDYRINVTQGTVLNLPNGSVDVTATVTDAKGGIKANQSVTLNMPEAMRGKFIIANGAATQQTNAQGEVKYTLKASSNFTSADLATFAGKSETLSFLLVDEHKAEKTATADLTFKDTSQIVSTLSVIKPDQAVAAKSSTPLKIQVLAKNDQHEPLSGKEIRLSFTKAELAYGVKLNNATAKTNAQGIAEFTISTADVTHPLALSDTGISLSATYTDGINLASGSVIVDVVTENTNASDADAIQRLEIASSYKVNAKNDSVAVTVKAINNKGLAATKGKVKLDLNAEATSNGVTLDGAAEKDLVNGFATFNIKTNAQTPAAVEALVKAGIKANFTTDNGVSNSIAITVSDEEVSEQAVRYLSIDPITSSTDPKLAVFDYTKNHTFTVKVKAVGVNGSALIGETVSLNIAGSLSDEQLQDLGLSHTGQSSKQTGADGYATFTIDYKANLSPEQAALAIQGVPLVATSANGKSQTLRLNFKAPTEQGVIDLDHFTVDMLGDLTLTVGQEQTLTVNVTAKGTDGELLKNQLISIGLNDAALNNGVSYVSTQAIRTDENGHAKFTIKVKAGNVSELTNLIANGLTVVVKSTRTDDSAFTVTKKVDVAQPPVVLPHLANFLFTTIEDKPLDPISVLGGETRVKITAVDEKGNPIPNTPIAIALSSLTSSRVSLSNIPTQTNSEGKAEFTVTVAEGEYDPSLIKNGIIFAVVGTNLNNGDRLQQTGSIQVEIPKDSVNLRMTADVKNVEYGQTHQIYIAVKDELGANTTGYPVQLTLNQAALDAGVRLSAESVMTVANSSVPVSFTIPSNLPLDIKRALEEEGVIVQALIKNPKGQELTAEIKFDVLVPQNPYLINLELSRPSMSSAGSSSTVTAKLVDLHGGVIANQPVQLSLADFIEASNAQFINNIYIDGPSTVQTDEKGNAEFTVVIPANADPDLVSLLESNGIPVEATHTATNGAIRTQRTVINVIAPTVQNFPQHALKMKSVKTSLNAVGDSTDVLVYVIDEDGGAVANQTVSFNVAGASTNGTMIVGPSMLTTNEVGEAKFTVRLDPSLLISPTTIQDLLDNGIVLTATHNNGERNITQEVTLPVIRNDLDLERLSIVIARDTTNLMEDATREYYLQNISVAVQDPRGNPIAQQQIQMDVDAVAYMVGEYTYGFPLDPNLFDGVVADWFRDVNQLWHPDTRLPLGPLTPAVRCSVPTSNLDGFINIQNKDSGEMRKVPTNVVDFVGHENQGNVLYTTDERGRVDLQIRYPKRFATWVTVELAASSVNTTQPDITHYSFTLPILSTDISATTHPAIESPYLGLNTSSTDPVTQQITYTCASSITP